jgi:DNA invertase Pin-like site-specific DNA recombinase
MKALILARVSSKEQEEGQSIPAQIRRLTELLLSASHAIPMLLLRIR